MHLPHLAALGNLCSMSQPKSKPKWKWQNKAALGNGLRTVIAELSHRNFQL